MNTVPKFNFSSKSLEDTDRLGTAIAREASAPILIELVGDLGGGKTALVKAIAKGLGIKQTVKSPTFNIHLSYKNPSGIRLEHFDLYRLNDDEIVLNELKESLDDDSSIVCVEWAQHFTNHVAADRLVIGCHYISENEREYEITANGARAQKVLEGVSNVLSN